MAKSDPKVECTRCNVEMKLGEMSGILEFYLDKENELTTGIKIGRRESYAVDTYRCPRCGLLELKSHLKARA